MGDVNQDGYVFIDDYNMVLDYYYHGNVPGFHPEYADVNLDGYIDLIDAYLIENYYMGYLPTLPLPPETAQPTDPPTPSPPPEAASEDPGWPARRADLVRRLIAVRDRMQPAP